jgi:hypothetical protein
MQIRVDIDNTICETHNTDYENASPYPQRINKINEWYDQGHTIIMWTSRGVKSHQDYYNLTYNQLVEWGVNFHSLEMNKPVFDLFIDDKSFNCEILDK